MTEEQTVEIPGAKRTPYVSFVQYNSSDQNYTIYTALKDAQEEIDKNRKDLIKILEKLDQKGNDNKDKSQKEECCSCDEIKKIIQEETNKKPPWYKESNNQGGNKKDSTPINWVPPLAPYGIHDEFNVQPWQVKDYPYQANTPENEKAKLEALKKELKDLKGN